MLSPSRSILGSKAEAGKLTLHPAPVSEYQHANRRHDADAAACDSSVILWQVH
jgi:hypothetical protein